MSTNLLIKYCSPLTYNHFVEHFVDGTKVRNSMELFDDGATSMKFNGTFCCWNTGIEQFC